MGASEVILESSSSSAAGLGRFTPLLPAALLLLRFLDTGDDEGEAPPCAGLDAVDLHMLSPSLSEWAEANRQEGEESER